MILSVRVVQLRRAAKVSLGHGEDPALERRSRAQGNLAEYAPLALFLIGILELSGFHTAVLHLLGIALVAGRFLHGWALSFTEGNMFGRVAGMILTFTVISIAALLNLYRALAATLIG